MQKDSPIQLISFKRMAIKRGAPKPAFMKGGTLIGFMLGLVLGLGVAVVVAIFVTRAPVPFMNKTNKAAERVLEGRASNEMPDPNKSMYGKPKVAPGPVTTPATSDTTPPTGANTSGSVLGDILSKDNTPPPPPPQSSAPPVATAPSALPPGTTTGKDPINDAIKDNSSIDDRTRYQLQAGAFRQEEDALSMQAKLALLGFESRVLNAQVKGETIFRVRVGPYKLLDDMNKARGRMTDNKIETTVIKITPAS